jgi:hypothetical protein
MEILDEERLHEKMWKAYDDHPLGWKYFFGKDRNGNYNVVIANRILGEQYWMKFTSPYGKDQICVGVRAGIGDEEMSKMKRTFFDMDFGVRPVNLTENEATELLKGNRKVILKEVEEIEKSMNNSPVSRDEVETSVVTVEGLYQILDVKSLEDISPRQKELNEKLEDELRRLKRKHLNYIS